MKTAAVRMSFSFVLFMAMVASLSIARAEEPEVRFLVVSNADYGTPRRLDGLEFGAFEIAKILAAGGAKGRILRSKPNKLITKADIRSAIENVWDDFGGARAPLFVFYYGGHCIGERYFGRQFLLPGNLRIDREQLAGRVFANDKAETSLIDTVDLMQGLRGAAGGNPELLVLLDCCNDSKDADANFRSEVVRLGARLASFSTSMRELRQFRDIFENVYFSSAPGNSTQTVQAPDFLQVSNITIGPLARAFLIASRPFVATGSDITWAFLHTELLRQNAYHFGPSPLNDRLLLASSRKQTFARQEGSARELSVVNLGGDVFTDEPAVWLTPSPGSSVDMDSPAGEWVGQGRTWKLPTQDQEMVIVQQGRRLLVRVERGTPYEYWNFEILLPAEVGGKSLPPISEEDFTWSDNHPIEVSATGRGCAVSDAAVIWDDLQLDSEGNVIRAEGRFRQRCGSSPELRGSLSLRLRRQRSG